jgi:3-oxoacyl-[acyl-carrier-protein] synthase-1
MSADSRTAPNGSLITAIGMCSPLGPSAVSSCAASRAGISRARELPDFEVLDADEEAMVPLRAHVVVGADGFSGVGRLIRLGLSALEDLRRSADLSDAEWGRTALLLNLSSGYHGQMAESMVSLDDGRVAFPDSPEPMDGPALEERRSAGPSSLLPRLLESSGLQASPHTEILLGDQAGFASALQRAAELLAGSFDRCIVGGIDCLVDPPALGALTALGLLKTPAHPTGFMPGEGAAFVLLERDDSDARTRPSPIAVVESTAVCQGDPHELSESPPTGRGLAGSVAGAADRASHGRPAVVIGGCNGSNRIAQDWGTAQCALPRDLIDVPQWFPAASFGETGAAAGPIALCLAARALHRGYAPGASVLTWHASPRGDRSAICLSKHGSADGAH